jgi:hypothetical protein
MEKVLVRWCLRALHGPAALRDRRLQYSIVAKAFPALLLLGVTSVALAVLLKETPVSTVGIKWLAGAGMAFATLGVLMAVEFFGVRHAYDDAGITFRSPWSPNRRIAWAEISRVEWRPVLKWLDLVPSDTGRRLHLHPMLGGLAPFARLALQQIPSSAWADRLEARAALQLMAAGEHAALGLDGRKPSAVARELLLDVGA